MKKVGMIIGLVVVMAATGAATFFGLGTLYPKHEESRSVAVPSADVNSEKQESHDVRKNDIVLATEARFTPETVAGISSPLLDGPESTNAAGDWKKMQSADGSLKAAVGNVDGVSIAKKYGTSQDRTDEAVRSMCRVLQGEYGDTTPDRVGCETKEVVRIPMDGADFAVEFQKVYYTYKDVDGQEYRQIALIRHGAMRSLFTTFTKKVSDWTEDEERQLIDAVKVVKYAE